MHSTPWKQILKKSSTLNSINIIIKSYCQERRARKSLMHYLKQAEKKAYTHSKTNIPEMLKKRILENGIKPIPKEKGRLHIFLCYAQSNWESILLVSLQPFGKVTEFEWRSRGFEDRETEWQVNREAMNTEMLKVFKEVHSKDPVDIVVGYLSGYNVSPQTLKTMGRAGAIIFNFCWDDKLNYPGKIIGGRYTSPAAIASEVDLNLTNAPESVIKYTVHGGLALFWPEAAHPDIHKPCVASFKYDVSFVGAKYGWRPKFIADLKKRGINVTCFGIGWESGALSDEEMVGLYSCSRINLGFSGVGYSKKLMCLKGRDFEVPMSGGLYLTQDNPELSLVYEVGQEIVTYKDEKDCAEKINYLLNHPKEADEIRKAGRTRALRDHTWEKRFQQIFTMTGLLEPSEIEGIK